MKVSLIIPVFNEEKHLEKFCRALDALDLSVDKELIFVNDCSTDSSGQILNEFSFRSETKIFSQDKNQGKGAALRLGIQKSSGDVIGIQDADFEYELGDVPALIEQFVQNQADVVYGSRFKQNGVQVHRTFHYFVNRVLTLLSNICSGLYLTDMETCYKFFRADIIKNIRLESNRFGFEPEVTAKIAKLKIRVSELPIRYYPRNYMEGKKITWLDGFAALWHILYFNLIADKRSFFKAELDRELIPKGAQWL